MTMLRGVKETLFGDDDDEERFSYRCNICRTAFDSTEPTVETAACPHCGANKVREEVSG